MTFITLLAMILFFVFIIGLCIGSFLNVVILRAFSNESIVLPPSKCPSCQTPLKWYHNIPVFSYLFLKGKCAFCKDVISIQYPVIELITGLLFVGVFLKFGLNLNALFIYSFVSLFVILAATDIKEKIIFDIHAYILVGLGLLYNLLPLSHFYLGDRVFHLGGLSIALNNSLIAAVLGIIAGIIIMELLARSGYLLAGTRAFGEGDSYIAAGLGAVFGWKYILSILLYAFIIQVVFTVPLFIKKLFVNKDNITLGLFLTFFIMVFGIKWLDYLNLISNLAVFLVFTLILCVVGLFLCKRILAGLKEESGMTYLPFGPAMVIGALIILFTV